MAVVMRSVELTAAQVEAFAECQPRGKVVVEQAVNIHATGTHTHTYFRFGSGRTKREFFVDRKGNLEENPTPGKGRAPR